MWSEVQGSERVISRLWRKRLSDCARTSAKEQAEDWTQWTCLWKKNPFFLFYFLLFFVLFWSLKSVARECTGFFPPSLKTPLAFPAVAISEEVSVSSEVAVRGKPSKLGRKACCNRTHWRRILPGTARTARKSSYDDGSKTHSDTLSWLISENQVNPFNCLYLGPLFSSSQQLQAFLIC